MAILKPDKTTTLKTGLAVNEYLLTAHNPNKIDLPAKRTAAQPLIGITLHNTDYLNVAAETTSAEQYTRATVNGNMQDTRVHYYVDDKCAWRNLGDDYTGWHAATGVAGQGNVNTISIGCIMRNQSDSVSVASMENAAKLIAVIFAQYGWTVEKNLFTHNYWTNYKATGVKSANLDAQSLKKVLTTTKCFNSAELANKNGKYRPIFILPQWEKFKALVKKYMGVITATPPVVAPAAPAPTPIAPTAGTFDIGDIVQFAGGNVYISANAPSSSTTKPASKCKVTAYYKGQHLYHVISEDGKGVYGWVDDSALSAVAPATVKKTVDEIAREVISGKWGAGDDRKKKLTAAGYDYTEVQKRVNQLLNV